MDEITSSPDPVIQSNQGSKIVSIGEPAKPNVEMYKFSEIIPSLVARKKVTRQSWNDKSCYLHISNVDGTSCLCLHRHDRDYPFIPPEIDIIGKDYIVIE